jgi:hypothetical protein
MNPGKGTQRVCYTFRDKELETKEALQRKEERLFRMKIPIGTKVGFLEFSSQEPSPKKAPI